jgi:hypothetical protein
MSCHFFHSWFWLFIVMKLFWMILLLSKHVRQLPTYWLNIAFLPLSFFLDQTKLKRILKCILLQLTANKIWLSYLLKVLSLSRLYATINETLKLNLQLLYYNIILQTQF